MFFAAPKGSGYRSCRQARPSWATLAVVSRVMWAKIRLAGSGISVSRLTGARAPLCPAGTNPVSAASRAGGS